MFLADAERIALQFNEQIRARDLAGLAALMRTDDRIIDRDGQVIAGKETMLDA